MASRGERRTCPPQPVGALGLEMVAEIAGSLSGIVMRGNPPTS